MAYDVSALTAYIEDRDFPLVGALQFDPELKAGRATMQDGVKGSTNLHFLETDVVFQDDDCTRTPSGTTTFTDKTLTVGKIAIQEDVCNDDLEGFWTQILLRTGVREGREMMPTEIAEVYMEQKVAKYKQKLAISDWRGDTGSVDISLNKYDGWIKFIDAGSAVNGNTGGVTVATGVSSANILDIIDAMVLAIPNQIIQRNDLCLDLPIEWKRMYDIALKNANLFHYKGAGVGDLTETIYGTNIAIKGDFGLVGTNRMFLSYDSNYVVGLDAENDGDFTMRVDPVTNKKILVDANFKRGTQVQFVEDVVEFTLVP